MSPDPNGSPPTEEDIFGPTADEGGPGTEGQLAATEAAQAFEQALAAVEQAEAVVIPAEQVAILNERIEAAVAAHADQMTVITTADTAPAEVNPVTGATVSEPPVSDAPAAGLEAGGDTINADGNLADAPDVISLYSGGWIRPLAPTIEDIDIVDIGHALSNQCRFTGHTSKFYSVAEHVVLCSQLISDPLLRLTALLHDASEAYLADVARPIKKAPEFSEYSRFEAVLEEMIARKFGTVYPLPEAVVYVDNQLLSQEVHTLMPQSFRDKWPLPDAATPRLNCWDPARAEIEFKHAFFSLTAAR